MPRKPDALPSLRWKDETDEHNYPAAEEYLSLTRRGREAAMLVEALRGEEYVTFKAKDVMRASRLPLLPMTNPYVRHHLDKLRGGGELSPVLLVRGDPLTIADGYHRVCTAYWIDQDSPVKAKIA